MSCCGGECSCGKNEGTVEDGNSHLVQLPEGGSILPSFDWSTGLNNLSVDPELVEVRFKNSRKFFFKNTPGLKLSKDDRVVVESGDGYDLGTVFLSGKAARKPFEQKDGDKSTLNRIYRKATEDDLKIWLNAKKRERDVLFESRKLAADKGLKISISDVAFRGDGLKVSIFHTASDGVVSRALLRKYALSFGVNVEMVQTGVPQIEKTSNTSRNNPVKVA